MSAKTAVELIARCREQVSALPEGEAFIRLLLKALTQEHGIRCVLLRLPLVTEACLVYVTILFAVLFSRFLGAKEAGSVVLDRATFSALPEMPSREAALRYLDQLTDLLDALGDMLRSHESPTLASNARQIASSEQTLQTQTLQARSNWVLFEECRCDFMRVLETVRAGYGESDVIAVNRLAVRDWWYTLETYPSLPQTVLVSLRQHIASLPLRLMDVHFENLEVLIFSEGFQRLPDKIQLNIVRILPVLLLDVAAFDNFAWILTENEFAIDGNWSSHRDLMALVDVLRCFILQGTEYLSQTAKMLKTLDRAAQNPFWDLLSLDALNRAAALSVGVDAKRLKTVVAALSRSAPPSASSTGYYRREARLEPA
ncbi:MAG: hypothetical protein P8176_04310 [Gammaproteobacteria bacterium]